MIYDILESKLDASGLVTINQNLFRGYMPEDVDIAVMTRPPERGINIDPDIPGFHNGQIMVVTRHVDPDKGAQLALAVSRVLTFQGRAVYPATAERGEVVLELFWPMNLPVSYPILSSHGFEWSQTFKAVFYLEPRWMN